MSSDAELLLSYARDRSESAFAELVAGHIDLVYSAAARRAGGDPHAAAEITQEVFVAMARHAERLARHPVLNAWLHACTRNAAANFHRREQRRERQRQQLQAMPSLHSAEEPAAEWEAVRDLLDEALDTVGELDRRALILRFFENRSFPEIGRILGLREEAARMRVGRALEKLRSRLARKGIASTAAALGGALSTQAVGAAPAGLGATVAAQAVSAAALTPAAGLVHLMSMSKTSASLAAAVALAGIGAVVYQHVAATKPPTPLSRSRAAPAAPVAQQADRPPADLAALVNDHQAKRAATASAATMEAEEKIAALRDVLARLPEQGIPELKLATNSDWHVAVDGAFDTADDYRRALAKIRSLAERRLAQRLQPALAAYVRANAGQFPTEPAQLQALAGEEVDGAMLRRYRVAPASEIKNVRMGGDWIITQNALIDSEHDEHVVIGPNGFGSCSSLYSSSARDSQALIPVMKAYNAAQGGSPRAVGDLLPYATTPEERAIIQRLAQKGPAPR